jgi:hypothetical protein
MVPLPESLVRQAFRSEDDVRERSLEEAHLHGPGFDAHRVGLEGLFFPRHAYSTHEPFVQVGRFSPKRVGESSIARSVALSEQGSAHGGR